MRKFKKFAKSRWHSIPLGAIAIALVASLAITGTVFALTLISNTWVSPSVTVTVKPLPLTISSNLGGDIARYTGVEIPFNITIHNSDSVGYTGIKTHVSIYRTDGDIAVGDVTLYDEWPIGTPRNITAGLSSVFDPIIGRWVLFIETSTHDLDAHGAGYDTDVTPVKVIFNTAGIYQASAHSEN